MSHTPPRTPPTTSQLALALEMAMELFAAQRAELERVDRELEAVEAGRRKAMGALHREVEAASRVDCPAMKLEEADGCNDANQYHGEEQYESVAVVKQEEEEQDALVKEEAGKPAGSEENPIVIEDDEEDELQAGIDYDEPHNIRLGQSLAGLCMTMAAAMANESTEDDHLDPAFDLPSSKRKRDVDDDFGEDLHKATKRKHWIEDNDQYFEGVYKLSKLGTPFKASKRKRDNSEDAARQNDARPRKLRRPDDTGTPYHRIRCNRFRRDEYWQRQDELRAPGIRLANEAGLRLMGVVGIPLGIEPNGDYTLGSDAASSMVSAQAA
ncbi:hypothetical protein BJ508DRAFT_75221 [Ascobolus immersus RN42]|uniref:Uncharacterized protein n=1 Tax=Ascobolus immersus RN42 TaxID=1160509 RepID=A0A3N4IAX0_ASCIM|nr:hypothetical protein BJ508DRAFT_75221 [Ascobolus immersus RN42]